MNPKAIKLAFDRLNKRLDEIEAAIQKIDDRLQGKVPGVVKKPAAPKASSFEA